MTTRRLSGFRLVSTHHGDTLQRVAARELGDAAQWIVLVEINDLEPPYITDDPSEVSSRVKLSGSQIIVPATSPKATVSADLDSALGRDLRLTKGRLSAINGKFNLVSGVDNYSQALKTLVVTEPGDLLFHPTYGCGVRRFIGSSNSRARAMLAGELVRRGVAADPRTGEVKKAAATVQGDRLDIEVEAVSIHDQSVGFEVIV